MTKTTQIETAELSTQAKNEITKFESFDSMDEMLSFSKKLIESKFLPGTIKTPEQAVSIILTGKELGFNPMTSFNNIHVIQNRPVLSVHAISALLKRRGFTYRIIKNAEPIKDASGDVVDLETSIEFLEMWNGEVIRNVVSFKYTQAVAQGLDKKENWKKMREIMMQHRCLTLGARFVAPDALMGMYSVDEMADVKGVEYNIDEQGRVEILD